MNPVIFYVDDEPNNLAVFEASVPDTWTVHTFNQPIKALEAIERLKPWLIVSDQRMPGSSGVELLEIARKIHPLAVRIIVTGYSDENLVIETVRKAKVFDYILKPWEPDELIASLERAIEHYKITKEKEDLVNTLREKEAQLVERAEKFESLTRELEASSAREKEWQKELECWIHPLVLRALNSSEIQFPLKRDLVGITFDIVKSIDIHHLSVNGRTLRSLAIQAFSESVIRHGGWRESHSGDSAYAHFGLFEETQNPFEAALSVAREFRVALRSLTEIYGHNIECGIALHLCKDSLVDVHTIQITTPRGMFTQKSFDTTSQDVDCLHKMEKLVHRLPGTNIIMSEDFIKNLHQAPQKLVELGTASPSLGLGDRKLFLLKSDLVDEEALQKFIALLRDSESSPTPSLNIAKTILERKAA